VTLRARLALALALVVLLPLAVVAVLLGRAVPQELRDRAAQQVAVSLAAVSEAARGACLDAQAAVTEAARLRAASPPPAPPDVAARLQLRGVPLLALAPPGAAPVLLADTPDTAGVPAADPAGIVGAADCSAGLDGPLVAATAATAEGTLVAALPVATGLRDRLRAAATAPGVPAPDVTLADRRGAVLATTLRDPALAAAVARAAAAPSPPGQVRGVQLGVRGLGGTATGTLAAVTVAPRGDGHLRALLGVVVVLAALVAAGLGLQLARLVTRPLAQLGAAAERIGAGELDTEIPVSPGRRDEVGTLAAVFGDMTGQLRSTIRALEGSRDELRHNLSRLGEMLGSTHDLNGILAVILDTALASVGATGGVLLLSSNAGNDLYLTVGRGLEDRLPGAAAGRPILRLAMGAGVLGGVCASGQPVRGVTRGPVGAGGPLLTLDPAEPAALSVIAVPLRASGRTTGVLGLYDRADGHPFDEADLETIRTFAAQAGVAVDNVLLHQEAQRLSITDGLTGLWNYRYLSMALAREVERAVRFGRPLSTLMLDLDRFKEVNDSYGHQRGDAVLIEVATRVKSMIREVDVLARYGGEELVLVLPETDREGAEAIAARVREVVRATPFGGANDLPVRVTISIGIAVHPDHGGSGAALLRNSDEALYAAKRAGRDTWRVAGSSPPPPATGGDPSTVPDLPLP